MNINEIKPGEVEFQGWIENLRDKKSMQFVVIRDLSGKIQVTVVKEEKPEIAEIFSHATLESTVKIKQLQTNMLNLAELRLFLKAWK